MEYQWLIFVVVVMVFTLLPVGWLVDMYHDSPEAQLEWAQLKDKIKAPFRWLKEQWTGGRIG